MDYRSLMSYFTERITYMRIVMHMVMRNADRREGTHSK